MMAIAGPIIVIFILLILWKVIDVIQDFNLRVKQYKKAENVNLDQWNLDEAIARANEMNIMIDTPTLLDSFDNATLPDNYVEISNDYGNSGAEVKHHPLS